MHITLGTYPADHPDETLRGKPRTYPLTLPNSIAEREDVLVAFGQAGVALGPLRRAYGAAVGLCCPPVARLARADYRASGYQLLEFGAIVYDYLRAQGLSITVIAKVARDARDLCAEHLPKEVEVKAREDFTAASAAHSIAGS